MEPTSACSVAQQVGRLPDSLFGSAQGRGQRVVSGRGPRPGRLSRGGSCVPAWCDPPVSGGMSYGIRQGGRESPAHESQVSGAVTPTHPLSPGKSAADPGRALGPPGPRLAPEPAVLRLCCPWRTALERAGRSAHCPSAVTSNLLIPFLHNHPGLIREDVAAPGDTRGAQQLSGALLPGPAPEFPNY